MTVHASPSDVGGGSFLAAEVATQPTDWIRAAARERLYRSHAPHRIARGHAVRPRCRGDARGRSQCAIVARVWGLTDPETAVPSDPSVTTPGGATS